jgi:hypothetical protein
VGVAIIGRPTALDLDDGRTAEITRLATDGTRNACSFLYGAANRAATALGFKRVITYIGADEPGTSLKASGWQEISRSPGRTRSRPGLVLTNIRSGSGG